MAVIRGNTTGAFNSGSYDNPGKIVSFSLCNKSGAGATASFAIFYGSSITYILYNKSISADETYVYSGEPIIFPANYQIYVNVSASTDYYFSIEMI